MYLINVIGIVWLNQLIGQREVEYVNGCVLCHYMQHVRSLPSVGHLLTWQKHCNPHTTNEFEWSYGLFVILLFCKQLHMHTHENTHGHRRLRIHTLKKIKVNYVSVHVQSEIGPTRFNCLLHFISPKVKALISILSSTYSPSPSHSISLFLSLSHLSIFFQISNKIWTLGFLHHNQALSSFLLLPLFILLLLHFNSSSSLSPPPPAPPLEGYILSGPAQGLFCWWESGGSGVGGLIYPVCWKP